MSQTCRDCGSVFTGERWQRLCWRCWRNQRDASTQTDAYRRGFADGLAAARSAQQATPLDAELLAAAVSLCHPDRHPPERAAQANATTARLLNLRASVAA